MTRRRLLATPIAPLLLEADDSALTAVRFATLRLGHVGPGMPVGEADDVEESPLDAAALHLDAAARQLAEYFAGHRTAFDLPVRATGTAFQQDVWAALTAIPYAATWSYRDVARHVGRPDATRAVGAACGRNPLAVVVPCHRVVGANGSLTGYAGGVRIKQALLGIEGRAAGVGPVAARPPALGRALATVA